MNKVSQVRTALQWRANASFKGDGHCSSPASCCHGAAWFHCCQTNIFFRDARSLKCVCEMSWFLLLTSGSVVKYNSLCQAKPYNASGLFLVQRLPVWVIYSLATGIDLARRLVQFSLWQESPDLRFGKLSFVQCSFLSHFVEDWFSKYLFLCQRHSWKTKS